MDYKRHQWDKTGFEYNSQKHEQAFMEALNKRLPSGIHMMNRPNQKSKFDCYIERTNKPTVKVELECGTKQVYWTDSLPRSRWPHGCSVLSRKVENMKTGQFDLFIKYNAACTSFFAFSTKWFLAEVPLELKEYGNRHSHLQVTNNAFVCIPWSQIDAGGTGLAVDNWKQLINIIQAL